ncbi:hypothetical protein WT98_04285 [Burkholderia territorii]|nr:hypothetical protein WT98_04285 [Burkholderia territorii]
MNGTKFQSFCAVYGHQAHRVDSIRSDRQLAKVSIVTQTKQSTDAHKQSTDTQSRSCGLRLYEVHELPHGNAFRTRRNRRIADDIRSKLSPIQENGR